ncbi:ABC transporter permease [Kribbella sp. NPDC051770]|uniref:ABC transporter permease n=1 Tax=Kribbella sp. NPDC051770 TaxID=3155413 RepID=UPI003418794F
MSIKDRISVGVAPPVVAAEPAPRALRGRRLVRRFLAKKMAVCGLALVVLFVLLALVGPLLAQDYSQQNLNETFAGPSAAHWLGTDDLGRDVVARLASGAQVSLLAGVFATALSMLVGIPLGLVAGYYRGWTDSVLMRLNDTVMAFPFLIFAVGMAAILGPSLRNVIIALAVSHVPSVVRIVRGETMVLRRQEFVDAAVADGATDVAIMGRYILPNLVNVLIVNATVAIPGAIIGEAALSFLGLGVQAPTPSFGTMLTGAQQFLTQDPLLAVVPGIAIALATLGFNLLGDGLRDVLDPRGKR